MTVLYWRLTVILLEATRRETLSKASMETLSSPGHILAYHLL